MRSSEPRGIEIARSRRWTPCHMPSPSRSASSAVAKALAQSRLASRSGVPLMYLYYDLGLLTHVRRCSHNSEASAATITSNDDIVLNGANYRRYDRWPDCNSARRGCPVKRGRGCRPTTLGSLLAKDARDKSGH